jgi:hypothetical protein
MHVQSTWLPLARQDDEICVVQTRATVFSRETRFERECLEITACARAVEFSPANVE